MSPYNKYYNKLYKKIYKRKEVSGVKGKKTFTRRECLSIVLNNGFVYDHTTGGHKIYKRNESETLSLPSREINPMVFRRLMKEYNLKEVY